MEEVFFERGSLHSARQPPHTPPPLLCLLLQRCSSACYGPPSSTSLVALRFALILVLPDFSDTVDSKNQPRRSSASSYCSGEGLGTGERNRKVEIMASKLQALWNHPAGPKTNEFDQNVHFVEIDIEEGQEIAEAAGIMGTSCVQFFKNKEMLRTVSGVKMKKEHREFIESNK